MNNKDESLLLIIEYPDHIVIVTLLYEHRIPAEDILQRGFKRNICQIR